eukprot:9373828-Alexandrium_andersonii.AAC.1
MCIRDRPGTAWTPTRAAAVARMASGGRDGTPPDSRRLGPLGPEWHCRGVAVLSLLHAFAFHPALIRMWAFFALAF